MTVAVNIEVMRRRLRSFDFTGLLVDELGWDHHVATVPPVAVDGIEFALRAVAQKRGLVVFECGPGNDGAIPPAPIRRRIEKQVSKWAFEHLIVFVDGERTTQVWQWVKRRPDGPDLVRHQTFYPSSSGDLLLEKLRQMVFDLDEEDQLTILDAAERVRRAFDVEKVTKKFYERFRAEHKRFLGHISGIAIEGDREWYASLMLNRLMFIYFIQRKGFLDGGDLHYLRNRLAKVQKAAGKDKFQSFYRLFLIRLFHEGLSKPVAERSRDLSDLIGKVPYLNGGLFDVHELERNNTKIHIPDDAFEAIFDFFDEFDWHLDVRPDHSDKEINPDVLGYIFEKYINQKQMGAYYTKEDVTGYICRHSIIPFILNAVRRYQPQAFQQQGLVWSLLADDPDAYIPESVRHGVTFDIFGGRSLPHEQALPVEISAGIEKPALRANWNSAAPAAFGLPAETWRECVARRVNYLEVRSKIAGQQVREISDLVALNIDLERFTRDIILQSNDPSLVLQFWKILKDMSVLDPTCGSGAFLFAALNILLDLYDACVEAMSGMLDDAERADAPREGPLKEFASVVEEVSKHPSREYFILKSAIVNNLYGVDLMEEAAEICKLRLFLKLVAQVDKGEALEPLPDVDFNIRPGNTLVGFTTLEEVRKALSKDLVEMLKLPEIENRAAQAAEVFRAFRFAQTDSSATGSLAEHKRRLSTVLCDLRTQMDKYLASAYGVKGTGPAFDSWRQNYKPFHWFVEFHDVMAKGGFDVIVGNPPYVEHKNVKEYALLPGRYQSNQAANLYANCMEQSTQLIGAGGTFGMIVPAGLMGLDDAAPLRKILLDRFKRLFFSSYAIRPSKLFDGVDQRLCIFVGSVEGDDRQIYTTRYHHWSSDERQHLFALLRYVPGQVHQRLNRIPQLGSQDARGILAKLEAKNSKLVKAYYAGKTGGALMHYHRSPRYWIRAMDFEQYFKSATKSRSVHHFRDIHFANEAVGKAIGAILNSTLFFFWFLVVGNGRNITGTDVEMLPVGALDAATIKDLGKLFDELMVDYKKNSLIRKRKDCELQEFRPSLSKPIIDKIDRRFGAYLGLTDSEIDSIINFEVKYRMGLPDDDED